VGDLQIAAKSSIDGHKAVTLCGNAAYHRKGKEGRMAEHIECCRYEPSLDDLLADEVMEPVLRSAGLELQELREMMLETARRIEDRERRSDGEEDAESG
jgi:hypothetical protein